MANGLNVREPPKKSASIERTTASFLKHVLESGLLSANQAASLRFDSLSAQEKADPAVLARRLVREGWLTAWQSRQIFAGRTTFFLGQYKLLNTMAIDGSGVVYRTEQTSRSRNVSLKIVQVAHDPRKVSDFHRAIQSAAAIKHPNIVAAYEADNLGPIHFLVMELIDGIDLERVANRDGVLSVATACAAIRQAAIGLQHLHERGMLHGDIRPANLILSRPENGPTLVKLFGAGMRAYIADDIPEYADYLAPEKVDNDYVPDIQADIFSLGCTLFRLLTGRKPFGGEKISEKLLARSVNDAPLIRGFRPELPAALESVISRSLSRRLEKRYSAPIEFAEALAEFCIASDDEPHTPGAFLDPLASLNVRPAENADPSAEDVSGDWAALESVLTKTTSAKSSGFLKAGAKPAAKGGAPRTVSKPFPWRWAAIAFVALLLLLIPVVGQQLGRAELTLDWPSDERDNAQLLVNDTVVPVPKDGAVAIVGDWGDWRLRIERPSHTPIETLVHLPFGGRQSFRPEFQPEGPPRAVAPFSPEHANELQYAWAKRLAKAVVHENSIGIKFALIPPGEFMMGSTPAEIDQLLKAASSKGHFDFWKPRIIGQAPRHKVKISETYFLQVTEVTVGQFRKFVTATGYLTEAERTKGGFGPIPGLNEWRNREDRIWSAPDLAPSDQHPVGMVTWNDAMAFVKWLSGIEKKRYGLPTEAQWEFACRAGSEGNWCFGDDESLLSAYGRYGLDGTKRAQAVGRLRPNGFGLYDMHGNLWEWCADHGSETYYSQSPAADPPGPAESNTADRAKSADGDRVVRGGAFHDEASVLRSSRRRWHSPKNIDYRNGFRVMRHLEH